MPKVLVKRGTKAQIDAAAGLGQLAAGEPYLMTDQGRIAFGTGVNSYETYAKQSETIAVFEASASEPIPAGSLVYLKSDGTCALANASVEGKEAIGFVLAGVSQGATATIYGTGGTIRGLSGLTPGAAYFMSATAGALVNAATAGAYPAGSVLMRVGTALSATMLLFSPQIPITL